MNNNNKIEFIVLPIGSFIPEKAISKVYLRADNWNDFSFVTLFDMVVFDDKGQFYKIGEIKIAFIGQTTDKSTSSVLPTVFSSLGDGFFSLGQGTEFYKNISLVPKKLRDLILSSLKDIVYHTEIIESIRNEDVFGTSLLRNASVSIIKGQYVRLLDGKAELTNYKFKYIRRPEEKKSGIELDFNVEVESKPPTNIHALIGRNGVGKTTVLNGMIEGIISQEVKLSEFYDTSGFEPSLIDKDYFSSLVSVSFSAFDPFIPPQEQPDPSKGTCYFYIGLKNILKNDSLKTITELHHECVTALIQCFYDSGKTQRWVKAIEKLGSDDNFSDMKLFRIKDIYLEMKMSTHEQTDSRVFEDRFRTRVKSFLERMSSGHAIVFLTITRLVATVDEKTLVLLDEPESHLHPPLLSAFIRSLSELLHDRNGLAIIATHSPVVLQEVPSLCVWKMERIEMEVQMRRPSIETFGENVGVLTREIFTLEVSDSGYHKLLEKELEQSRSYKRILKRFDGQLGSEAKGILRSLILAMENGVDE
jgi:predicted ATPase